MGICPIGYGGPGRLDPPEGSLKGTGAGCPPEPLNEPARKKTGVAEQGAILEAPGEKKRIYLPWKKGRATQKEYKEVVKMCREKIRKAKAQLELNLAAGVKGNKKLFYSISTVRGGPGRISILYWMRLRM